MTSRPSLREVLAYEPVPSRFGTSGVRALVKDLTDLEVYCLTVGTLRYLRSTDRLLCAPEPPPRIAIPVAGDLRPSTERLLQATARGIQDMGFGVDYVGHIPTPALTFYGIENGVASFVITGSHIPADRNGQKANRCDGEVLKSDEGGIVAEVQRVRDEELARPADESPFSAHGMFKEGQHPSLPAASPAAREGYAQRYRMVFAPDALRGLRVLFFQYTAVGRDLIPEILEQAGAEVIRAGRSNTFVPIDTEAISDSHLELLSGLVREHHGQGPIDAVVSTDGDSDRPLVVAVDGAGDGDPRLRFIPGDLLGIFVADYLGADSVSVPISVSPAVHEYFAQRGLTTRKTRIGSPYVIQAMSEALEQGHRRVVAWEANGGFLVGSDLSLERGMLRALPTRDAVLPILAVLHTAVRDGVRLSELPGRLPQWFGRAHLLDDFPHETSRRLLAYFAAPRPGVEWVDFEADRIVLRDNAEQEVASWDRRHSEAQGWWNRKRLLEAVFSPKRGFGELRRLNLLDGIRCYFDNGDIAHVRPSGNAPQLRIYAHARTQARADAIARMGVAEPDGLLRRLQALIDSLSTEP